MSKTTVNPQFQIQKLTPEHAVVFVGAALFLAILSPFGTDSDLTISIRFLYWFSVILGGTVIALTVSNLFQNRVKAKTGLGYAFAISIQILTASIPITVLVAGIEMWLRDPLGWAVLPYIFPYVVTIATVITVASQFVKKHRDLRDQIGIDQACLESQMPLNESFPISRFHLRLDPQFRQEEIRMLKAEDHYLRVYTSKGTKLVRCNLSVAIDELGPHDGQRVHRSFWVARSEILSVKRHGNAYRLVMKDGKTVPVSRRRYTELSKRDWFPF